MQDGAPREAINDEQTMVCPATEFVSYYKRALAGEFFQSKEAVTSIALLLPRAAAAPMIIERGWVGSSAARP